MSIGNIFKAAAIILALTAAYGCTDQKTSRLELYRKRTNIMYTTVAVTVAAKNPEQADKAIEAAFYEIRSLERLLNFWTENSEIAAINKNAGKAPVRISPQTMRILQESIKISKWTDGAFDPTVGPVIRLWDFKNKTIPGQKALKDALARVDYTAMELDTGNSTAFLKRSDMSFDTGGIAKGFAADAAIEKLKKLGIKAALVSVAGDIRAYGKKPDGESWRIGIRDPRSDDQNAVIASLALDDEAISTSGDYERFFIKNNKRFHHILDPHTGMPAEGAMSVTVISPSTTYTDALATGVFVLGPKGGLHLLEEHDLQGIIVSSEGKTFVTSGLKGRIKWRETTFKP